MEEATTLPAPTDTLLIVDDEPTMLDLFRLFMTKRGYRVLTAATGQEALALIPQEGAALRLIVTDMSMPDIEGLELINAMNAQAPDIPIIIATGHDLDRSRMSLPDTVKDIYRKPYKMRDLAERIQEILTG